MNAVAPKTNKRIEYKKLTFTNHRGEIRMERITDKDYTSRSESLTPRLYDRFVALAGHPDYMLTIENSDYGVAWSISRFAKK